MVAGPWQMTCEEMLRLPDDGLRHELVDGELRTMAPPGGAAGRDLARVWAAVAGHVYAEDLGECFAETSFLLRRGPDTVLTPDFAFVRAERLPRERVADR